MIPPKTCRVLVIDDEPEILDLFRAASKYASSLRVTIVATSDPREGVQFLREQVFQVVFADSRTPRVNGLTFLHHAREENPQARRILMDGYDLQEHAPPDLGGVVDSYLQKPFTVRDLIACIRSNEVDHAAPGPRLPAALRKDDNVREAIRRLSHAQAAYDVAHQALTQARQAAQAPHAPIEATQVAEAAKTDLDEAEARLRQAGRLLRQARERDRRGSDGPPNEPTL